MNKNSSQQLLNLQKSLQSKNHYSFKSKNQSVEKKHQSLDKFYSFNQILNHLKSQLHNFIQNQVHRLKMFQIVDKLKEKYQKDIFTLYEATLKFHGKDLGNQNQKKVKQQNNKQKNSSQKDDNCNKKLETNVEFLPIESLLTSTQNYKITLNGDNLDKLILNEKTNQNSKPIIQTKLQVRSCKTTDSDTNSGDNEESPRQGKMLNSVKSMQDKTFLANQRNKLSQESNSYKKPNNPIQSTNTKSIKGVDYLNSLSKK